MRLSTSRLRQHEEPARGEEVGKSEVSAIKPSRTTRAPLSAYEVGGKAAATRQRILNAAAHVLAERGFSGMRLADVGEVAGIQAPAIYYHFSNKDELAVEVFVTGLTRCRTNLDGVLKEFEDDDPLERLALAIDAHLRLCARYPDYTRAVIHRIAGGAPEHVQEQCRADERAYVRIWTRLISDAKTAGLLRDDVDAKVAQQLILGALNALTTAWPIGRTTPVDAVIASAQQILLSGLSNEEREWSRLDIADEPQALP
jgi:TetR/AcrR family transcriptional regulator, cholesterol catabolism regulator